MSKRIVNGFVAVLLLLSTVLTASAAFAAPPAGGPPTFVDLCNPAGHLVSIPTEASVETLLAEKNAEGNGTWTLPPCTGDEEECPVGQHWDGEECVDDPIECPEGQHLDDGICVEDTLECPDGQHQEGEGDDAECVDDPLECPDGQHLNEHDQCVPDTVPTTPAKSRGKAECGLTVHGPLDVQYGQTGTWISWYGQRNCWFVAQHAGGSANDVFLPVVNVSVLDSNEWQGYLLVSSDLATTGNGSGLLPEGRWWVHAVNPATGKLQGGTLVINVSH